MHVEPRVCLEPLHDGRGLVGSVVENVCLIWPHLLVVWMLLGGTAGGGEAVAAGAGFDDVSPVGHAIDNGGGEAGVGEGFSPFGERGVAGDGDGCPFLAFGEDLEEQLGGALVEVDVAELVKCQVMHPGFGGEFDSTERWDYANIEEISRGTASDLIPGRKDGAEPAGFIGGGRLVHFSAEPTVQPIQLQGTSRGPSAALVINPQCGFR